MAKDRKRRAGSAEQLSTAAKKAKTARPSKTVQPAKTFATVKPPRPDPAPDRALTGSPAFFKTRAVLPVTAQRAAIRQALRDHDVLILSGETGSGKSTQLPQFLYDEPWCKGMVAVTQPRRIAATSLAYRVAQEMGTPLPKQWLDRTAHGLVGYSVRFEFKMPSGTRIKYMTEGMLLKEMLSDRSLERYSVVVVDEVHERSLNADLLLGFLRLLQTGACKRKRAPLKIVVMSATAQLDKFAEFFGPVEGGGESGESAGTTDITQTTQTSPPSPPSPPSFPPVKVLTIPGRQFPVRIVYAPDVVPQLDTAIVERVAQINKEEPLPGDVLVFLAGRDEIEGVAQRLAEQDAMRPSDVPKLAVHALYGQMSLEDQQTALQPTRERFTRKIILATNVAETSVTVPGVRHVIDTGKHKRKRYDTTLGLETLMVDAIAQPSAVQRAGRAGREAPGTCYRLYTAETFDAFAAAELPEVLRIDVLDAVLTLASHDIANWIAFPLPDRPAQEALEQAASTLYGLGALQSDLSITAEGRVMARLPVSAPFGRVLLAAADQGADCLREAIDIVACLTAGDTIFLRYQDDAAAAADRNDGGHDAAPAVADATTIDDLRQELRHRSGDLLTYFATLGHFATMKKTKRTRAWCHERRLHHGNLLQAVRIRLQLRRLLVEEKLLDAEILASGSHERQEFVPLTAEKADALLKCFLLGFATKTAFLAPDQSYISTKGKHVLSIHPSSVLQGVKTRGIMFMQNIFTQKNYVRHVSRVDPEWIMEAYNQTEHRP